jgi:hypothetical protein
VKCAALVLALCACQATDADHELGQAKATTRQLFDAVTRADCPTIGALVAEAATPAGCTKLVHEWRDDLKLSLVAITDVRRDGRDKRAIIVTTNVMRRGRQEKMLLRFTHDGGAWRLAL